MTDQKRALEAGMDSIAGFMRAHALTFALDGAGPGSGGSFARGVIAAGDCRVRISYRSGLGDIQLEAAGITMPLTDYLRAAGHYSSARYPSMRKDAADQFDVLAHDLAEYCAEFLAGKDSKFLEAYRRWRENPEQGRGLRGLPG